MKKNNLSKLALYLMIANIALTGCIPEEKQAEKQSICFSMLKPEVQNKIIITEISFDQDWIEIYNSYPHAIDLQNYTITINSKKQKLPQVVIQPDKHFVIKITSKNAKGYGQKTQQYGEVEDAEGLTSDHAQTINIRKNKEQIEDLVILKKNIVINIKEPNNLKAISYTRLIKSEYKTSIIRAYPYVDRIWRQSYFPTKGGMNDIPASETADLDKDNIPDYAEANNCRTYNGLPYYKWGARQEQRDLFIQIDKMDLDSYSSDYLREALEMITEAYKQHDDYAIYLHADAVLDQEEEQNNPDDFKLYSADIKQEMQASILKKESHTLFNAKQAGYKNIADYAYTSMDIRRHGIFHYMTLVKKLKKNAEKTERIYGIANTKGYYLLVTDQREFFSNDNKLTGRFKDSKYWIFDLAHTMFHELGHNLGLDHGGLDAIDKKPNHISVMNSLFHHGVPNEPITETINYLYNTLANTNNCGLIHQYLLKKTRQQDATRIDYSLGNENSIDETYQDNTVQTTYFTNANMFPCVQDILQKERERRAKNKNKPLEADNEITLKDYNEWKYITDNFDYKRKK